MSAESEFTRDKDGFLKCQDCPRRFLTETGFENHSTNQHEKEIKPDQNQQYGPSFPKNTQSKEECSPDNLLFRSQVDLKLHRSVEHQITANHCNECKKLFRYEIDLKKHQQKCHQLSPLRKCKECNGISMQRMQEIFWAKVRPC